VIRCVTLAWLALLPGCSQFGRRSPASLDGARYTVGDPYQAGGVWYYPREQLRYVATGLATVVADHKGRTADGEAFDASALAASHQTLQLPAVVIVTDLDNGRAVRVRLNDRGPGSPSRLIALTSHAAALLQAGGGARVRLDLDEAMTHALAEQLGGGPKIDVTPAPLGEVRTETLALPTGAAQSRRVRQAVSLAPPPPPRPVSLVTVPARLPDTVAQTPPEPGRLFIRSDEFGRAEYARRSAARLGGTVECVHRGRTDAYRVRAGPYATVPEADAALDRAHLAGVFDARIVVEFDARIVVE